MKRSTFPMIGTLALGLFQSLEVFAADRVPVLPAPVSAVYAAGTVKVAGGMVVTCNAVAPILAEEFARRGLKTDTGVPLLVSQGHAGGPGAYALTVATNGITILGADAAGQFYGVQSLLWLLDAAGTGAVRELRAVKIDDAPRYPWRGYMLDESRFFFGVAEVKKLLDAMARLKMNVFHWHLTDEPGWRIEIKKYPKLTEIGGKGTWANAKAPAQFYTQDQIREIVAYAAARHIEIVPEIDMPGHANAATRAYPEVGAPGPGRWNGFTFDPAKEETYTFLQDVLTEVAELFPSKYLHVGGDEVHYGNQGWTGEARIVSFTKAQGLKNAVELEHWFMRRIGGFVQQKLGKKLVGWDEVSGAGLPNDGSTVPMWWHHEKPKILDQLIAGGFPVILAPRHPLYYDFVQHESHKVGRRWDGFNALERVYNFPESLDAQLAKAKPGQILGVNACVWTERIADAKRLHYMTFPRLAATAESGWSPKEAKHLDDFRERVRTLFLPWLDRAGYSYFNPFDPASTPEPNGPDKADIIANG